jgi:hypothetical protein
MEMFTLIGSLCCVGFISPTVVAGVSCSKKPGMEYLKRHLIILKKRIRGMTRKRAYEQRETKITNTEIPQAIWPIAKSLINRGTTQFMFL